MSSVFNCVAYEDIDATIRLDGRVVYLALEDAEKRSSIHLTLNPFQVRILAKYLSVALDQIDFADLHDENNFGDTQKELDDRERFYISKLDCKVPNGYNTMSGGNAGVRTKNGDDQPAMIKKDFPLSGNRREDCLLPHSSANDSSRTCQENQPQQK